MSRKKLFRKVSSAVVSSAMALGIASSMLGPVPVKADVETPYNLYGNIKLVDVAADNTAGYRRMLCDESGNPIQLKGMSTFGLQWEDGAWVLNEDVFEVLAQDWQCDIIRLAMYVTENGYATDPAGLLAKVEEGIQLATDQGLYVLVDWHILNEGSGNPNAEVCADAGVDLPAFASIKAEHPDYTGPQLFFAYLSQKYGAQGNVLFETANEPNGNGSYDDRASVWEEVLLPYHQGVVDAIREYDADDNDNIVICGTDNWSQFVDAPIGHEVNDENNQIMYTFHFYAGTHDTAPDEDGNYWLGSMIDNAIDNGLAVMCTEWGTSEATGDGGPYINYSERWLDYLEENNISWCSWSLAQKNEISAACHSGTPEHPVDNDGDGIKDWEPADISVTGAFVRAMIRGEEAPLYLSLTDLFDFEDASDFDAFSREGGNTNEAVTLEPIDMDGNTIAALSGMSTMDLWASNDSRVQFSINDVYGIYLNLEMDVIVATKDAGNPVSIQAILQDSVTENWWIQLPQADVTEYYDLGNGYSQARVIIPLESVITDPKDSATNLMLIVGATNTIYLDNIAFASHTNGDISTLPRIPDEPGEFAGLPFDFEIGGRQGWKPEGDSTAVNCYQDIVTVEMSDGNHAMTFPVAFADNTWEAGVRLSSSFGLMTYEEASAINTIVMDIYLEKDVGTTGSVVFAINPIPDGDGWWYGSGEFAAVIGEGEETGITVDGVELVRYQVAMPLNSDGSGVYPFSEGTPIRNLIIACHNGDSDYEGNVYYDNIGFEYVESDKVNSFVTRLYNIVLGREPEEDGLAYWTQTLKDGENCGTAVACGFFFSSEYLDADKSDEEFITDLYTTLMDREPEEAGMEFWMDQLASGASRLEVYAGFANAPEFAALCEDAGLLGGYFMSDVSVDTLNNVNAFVDRLYNLTLGRRAEQEGQAYWVDALISQTVSGAGCADGFISSDEFAALELTDEDYVETMYSVFFDRESDEDGKAYWVEALAGDMDRYEVFCGFANSDEYAEVCSRYGIIREII